MSRPRPPDPTTTVLDLTLDDVDVDVASGMLWAAGAVAVGESTVDGRTVLRASTGTGDADGLRDAALRWAPSARGAPPEVRTTSLDEHAGLDAWRDHARPWRAGERIVVWPTWVPIDDVGVEDRPGPEDLVLRIDPGRAFGSGSHPSTRLALAALDGLVAPGDRVADVGCGSGVLAIAAALLGASDVEAVDVDPEAVAATEANARANGVDAVVHCSLGSTGQLTAPADVVIANVLAPVLRSIGPSLAAVRAPDGVVIVAGLLDHQADAVVRAVGLPVRAHADDEGWACLTLG